MSWRFLCATGLFSDLLIKRHWRALHLWHTTHQTAEGEANPANISHSTTAADFIHRPIVALYIIEGPV